MPNARSQGGTMERRSMEVVVAYIVLTYIAVALFWNA